MDIMNIRFIGTNKLIFPYDKDKFFGYFVYLMEQQNNYKPGLYFGGKFGWEKLTNRMDDDSIEMPHFSEYYYTGETIEFFPINWNEGSKISRYCTIENNTGLNVGEYFVLIKIFDKDGYLWEDGRGNEDWEGVVKILPAEITSATIILDKSNIVYGDNLPFVSSVSIENFGLLTNGVDYDVIYPDEINAGDQEITIRLKGNYSGEFKKTIHVDSKVIESPVWNYDISYDKVYDGISSNVYPDNWNSIKDYCIIQDADIKDAGLHTCVVELNNPNYVWSDTNDSESKRFEYTILKADGYGLNPRIILTNGNNVQIQNTVKFELDSSSSPSITYKWFRTQNLIDKNDINSDVEFIGNNSEYTLTKYDYGYYIGIVVIVNENNNYNEVSLFEILNESVDKISVNDFSFVESSAIVSDKDEYYILPKTNKLSVSDNSTISYISNNTDIATVDSNGKVTIKHFGEVEIIAIIKDSDTYNYVPNSAKFILTITTDAVVYWGMCSKDTLNSFLDNGLLPDDKKIPEIKSENGKEYIEVSTSEYENRYNTWYIAIPNNMSIGECVESDGISPISVYKLDNVSIDSKTYGGEYSIYSYTKRIGTITNWKYKITFK